MPPSRKSRRRRPGSKRSKQRSKQRSRRRDLAGGVRPGGVRPSASTVAALALGSTVGAVGALGAVGAAGGLSVLKKPVAFNEISMTKLINDAKTMSELYLVGAKLLVTFIENRESPSFDASSFNMLKTNIGDVLDSKRQNLRTKGAEDLQVSYGALSGRVLDIRNDINSITYKKTN